MSQEKRSSTEIDEQNFPQGTTQREWIIAQTILDIMRKASKPKYLQDLLKPKYKNLLPQETSNYRNYISYWFFS